MPDGCDEWAGVPSKEETYSNIMNKYYQDNPTFNGEVGESQYIAKLVHQAVYGTSNEYHFNGG